MARWRIGATSLDHRIARAVARRATPVLERPSLIQPGALTSTLLFLSPR